MVVDKRVTGEAGELEIEEKDVTEVVDPGTTDQESVVEMMEDGSAIINPEEEMPAIGFYDNIAEVVEESELQRISNKLLGDYENAKDSRKDICRAPALCRYLSHSFKHTLTKRCYPQVVPFTHK